MVEGNFLESREHHEKKVREQLLRYLKVAGADVDSKLSVSVDVVAASEDWLVSAAAEHIIRELVFRYIDKGVGGAEDGH